MGVPVEHQQGHTGASGIVVGFSFSGLSNKTCIVDTALSQGGRWVRLQVDFAFVPEFLPNVLCTGCVCVACLECVCVRVRRLCVLFMCGGGAGAQYLLFCVTPSLSAADAFVPVSEGGACTSWAVRLSVFVVHRWFCWFFHQQPQQ